MGIYCIVSRYHSYLNSASQILKSYQGEEPFAIFIKKYFAGQKKFGSTDRKLVSQLCYCYFRLGKALPAVEIERRIILALYLCSANANSLLENLDPLLNVQCELTLTEKLETIHQHAGQKDKLSIYDIFPWTEHLSAGIDREKYVLSHFSQPLLFIRLRPGYENRVKDKLQKAGINFFQETNTCLALPNFTRLEGTADLNREVVIQDINSQRTIELLGPALSHKNTGTTVWDCCAASGGKSLAVYDQYPGIKLTVSDIRENILSNLRKRFAEAGVKNYDWFVADLSNEEHKFPEKTLQVFDLIIADLPCTGSGTWSRTPEQLYFFDEAKIAQYSALQKQILAAVLPRVKSGGYLLYITCSVFHKENEEVVSFIKSKGLEKIDMKLLSGYEKQADTLFTALLRKPS